MKIKSNKKINIRAFKPYIKNNNIKGVLNSGFEIEVEEVEGEDIKGNVAMKKELKETEAILNKVSEKIKFLEKIKKD